MFDRFTNVFHWDTGIGAKNNNSITVMSKMRIVWSTPPFRFKIEPCQLNGILNPSLYVNQSMSLKDVKINAKLMRKRNK